MASASSLTYFAGFRRSGGTWSEVELPYSPADLGAWDPADAVYGISGLACASTRSCMAVGLGSPYQLVTSRGARSFAYLNGGWKAERIALPPGVSQARPAEMLGIASKGAGYVAVGNFFTNGPLSQTAHGMASVHK